MNKHVMTVLLTVATLSATPLKAQSPSSPLPHYQSEQALSGHLRFVAESSTEKLTNLWVDRFKKLHPKLNLIAKLTSPLAAIPMVTSGACDLGFPAREAWPYEAGMFRQVRGYDISVIRVGLGALKTTGFSPTLGIYVNANNPIERLTMAQLDAIYSSERRRGYPTDIKTWGDVGVTGEWARRPIKAYAHRLPSGVRYYLQEVVTRGAEFKRSVIELDMRAGTLGPDDMMARATAADPDAIGHGCFGNLIPGMKTIPIAESARGPYYAGTLEEVKTMKYPLTRPIYMFVDRPPGQPLSQNVREFLSFLLSQEGQQTIVDAGEWLPLPAQEVVKEREKLK
ncbi:MAG: substrate-binding domain-containing protein [Opitutaceae bacterium]|nr:substrate-binding domain-containing protein [Opitutaceae bacterium]